MASTYGRLSLGLISTNDLVDVGVLNNNMRKISDALTKSYVTSSASSNTWRYRRWSSNWIDMWYDDRLFTGTFLTEEDGPLFVSPTFQFPSYPFAFASKPQVHIDFVSCSSGSNITRGGVEIISSRSLTVPPQFRMVSTQAGKLIDPHFCIHVSGKVK